MADAPPSSHGRRADGSQATRAGADEIHDAEIHDGGMGGGQTHGVDAHPDGAGASRGTDSLRPACTPSGAACHTRGEQASESNPEAAETILNSCLACADIGPATYRLLATLRTERGAKDRARETLQIGVRRFPQSLLLWRALGRLELSMSRHREGLSAIAAAHRLDPEDGDLEAEYRQVLSRYGTEEDRLEAAVHPLLLEAISRFEIDDSRGALQVLDVALKRAEKSPRLRALVRHRQASIHVALQDYPKAKTILDIALREANERSVLRSEILVTQSEVLLAQGDARGATNAASAATEIEPKSPLAHANLGLARSLAGDLPGALRALSLAVDCGLGRRLTKEQFLSIGKAVDNLKPMPEFPRLLERGWPTRTPSSTH